MADATQQADQLLDPSQDLVLAQGVQKEDLAGTFSVHLRVNPDLPWDRSVQLQLAQFIFPYLAQRYPIGARLLLKKLWELHGQTGFDAWFPEVVSLLETQKIMHEILMQLQMQGQQMAAAEQQQQAQGQPQQPGMSPETLALQEQHAQSAAHHGMQQHAAQTTGAHAKAMQQVLKMLHMGQNGGGQR